MRIVAWNVGHRTRAKSVPDSVIVALTTLEPDVLILTEYVAGPDHERMVRLLAEAGLCSSMISDRVKGQNQVLVVARHSLEPGSTKAPDITPATAPNLLHVLLPDLGCQVIGCRVPMFKRAADRERYWTWFRSALGPLSAQPIVIVGDLNVDPSNPRSPGTPYLAALEQRGWRTASPSDGANFFSHRGGTSRLDHALLGKPVRLVHAEYLTKIGTTPLAGPDSSTYSDYAILRLDVSLCDG